MQGKLTYIACISVALLVTACSKKHLPEATPAVPVKKTEQTPLPKVITVHDSVAKKSADGRLYYDLEGHRYWRNYNDGKYYLFNKSMYENDAFRPR